MSLIKNVRFVDAKCLFVLEIGCGSSVVLVSGRCVVPKRTPTMATSLRLRIIRIALLVLLILIVIESIVLVGILIVIISATLIVILIGVLIVLYV